MAQRGLDNLLRAIHESVLHAQQSTEEQHILQLEKYFDPDGLPIVKEISVPSLRLDAAPNEMDVIRIPLLSLIPPTAIKIKKMSVKFQVGLNSSDLLDGPETGTGNNEVGALQIDLGGSGGLFGSKQSLAEIEITFEGTDPAESFLRINNHLVKTII